MKRLRDMHVDLVSSLVTGERSRGGIYDESGRRVSGGGGCLSVVLPALLVKTLAWFTLTT